MLSIARTAGGRIYNVPFHIGLVALYGYVGTLLSIAAVVATLLRWQSAPDIRLLVPLCLAGAFFHAIVSTAGTIAAYNKSTVVWLKGEFVMWRQGKSVRSAPRSGARFVLESRYLGDDSDTLRYFAILLLAGDGTQVAVVGGATSRLFAQWRVERWERVLGAT